MALIGGEHVHHDRPEIDQNPAAVVVAFGSGNREAVAARCFGNRVGDRARLDFRSAGHDDERVGDDRATLEVENREIFAFLVVDRTLDGGKEFGQNENLSSGTRGDFRV